MKLIVKSKKRDILLSVTKCENVHIKDIGKPNMWNLSTTLISLILLQSEKNFIVSDKKYGIDYGRLIKRRLSLFHDTISLSTIWKINTRFAEYHRDVSLVHTCRIKIETDIYGITTS